jgi:SAM-dependent methyltransferase
MSDLQLPEGYTPRKQTTAFLDNCPKYSYQPHVYEAALDAAVKSGVRNVIDIGCGSGLKLVPFGKLFNLYCIDSQGGLALARTNILGAHFIEHNLEQGLPDLPDTVIDNSIIICSDVLEHLVHPQVLAKDLARSARRARYVFISTPDRDRARGWIDTGPPANPAHVHEWSGGELIRFLTSSGFDHISFCGHTINTDFHRAKATSLVISGRETARPCPAPEEFRVAAVLHLYNESDIIAETVHHLASQDIEIHAFDNWSQDGTYQILEDLCSQGLVNQVARFPNKATDQYSWAEQLQFTAAYGRQISADWIMHHDADELRFSPWPHTSLRDSIWHVDSLGYNAIDFTVLDFRFLAGSAVSTGSIHDSLNFFEFGRRPGHFKQVKLWRNLQLIELAESGGHSAEFDGR